MKRVVEPEWLDELPADDPRAVRSRGDLRRVNRLIGSAGIIARPLRAHLTQPSPRIAELGTGDGALLARVLGAARLRQGADVVLVDRQPVVSAETGERFRKLDCRVTVETADVFDWLARTRDGFDAIVVNLFLHHFDDAVLARLLAGVAQRTRLFVACEPRRGRMPLAATRLLGLIGCNDVTRHDAVLSVHAGFTECELSALWPADGWTTGERRASLFSHLFVAHR